MKENRKQEAFCPSCERFIGPADVCPYCDCDSAKNPMFRFLRVGAVVLAVSGLFFLYLMAVHSEIPLVGISGITPMMNFGLVRVKGVVEKEASNWRRKGQAESVSFTVNDGSGLLRVVAYGQVARTLIDNNLLPKMKEVVEVTGSLSVSADGNSRLILRKVEELRIGQNGDAGQRLALRLGLPNSLSDAGSFSATQGCVPPTLEEKEKNARRRAGPPTGGEEQEKISNTEHSMLNDEGKKRRKERNYARDLAGKKKE